MNSIRFSLITEREVLDLPREAGTLLLCLFTAAWLHLIFFVAWEALLSGGPGLFRAPRPAVTPLEIVLTLDDGQEEAAALQAEAPGESTVEEPAAEQAGESPAGGIAETGPPDAPAEALEAARTIDPALALAEIRPEEAGAKPAAPVTVEPEAPDFKSYNTAVRSAVFAKWLEPPEARSSLHYPSRLVVNFTIGRDGALIRFVVDESTGNAILDHAALEALRSAAPFPPFPRELAVFSQLDFNMIFNYQPRYIRRPPSP